MASRAGVTTLRMMPYRTRLRACGTLHRPLPAAMRHRVWTHLPSFAPRLVPSLTESDNLEHPRVRRLLRDEAAYVRAALNPLTGLQMTLYDEMASRLPDEVESPPEPIDKWLYYSKSAQRRDLPQFCRRLADGGPEQILLDLGALADRHGYAALGSLSISADHGLLSCTLDLDGSEAWELRVIEIASGRLVSRVDGVLNAEWANGEALVYTQLDSRGRAWRAQLHTIGSPRNDVSLYEESDEAAMVDVALTKGRRWLTINSNTTRSSEVRLIRTEAPLAAPPLLVSPRESGIRYFVDELCAGWLLLVTDADASRQTRGLGLSAVSESELPCERSRWVTLRAASEDVPIEDIDAQKDWLVLYERSQCIPQVRIVRKCAAPLQTSSHSTEAPSAVTDPRSDHKLAVGRPHPPVLLIDDVLVPLPNGSTPCEVSAAPNREHAAHVVNFTLSSPTTPPTAFAFDMRQRLLSVRAAPIEPPSTCELHSELAHARARDGTMVPVTLVHSAALQLSSHTPLHCVVYGSYGAVLPAEWRAEHLPLLERGWVVALAHVRGGGELGPKWHRAGSALQKSTSATDLCDVLRSLHARGISQPSRSTLAADSAGALALGGMLNLADAPVVAAALMRSPFLDPLGAMLDTSLPLTLEEREEWGDPSSCAATRSAMEDYSPYAGINGERSYPAMLVICAEADVRVPCMQSVRYVQRLRNAAASRTASAGPRVPNAPYDDDTSHSRALSPKLLHVRSSGGHLGDGGRFRRLEQASMELAFLMHAVGES